MIKEWTVLVINCFRIEAGKLSIYLQWPSLQSLVLLYLVRARVMQKLSGWPRHPGTWHLGKALWWHCSGYVPCVPSTKSSKYTRFSLSPGISHPSLRRSLAQSCPGSRPCFITSLASGCLPGAEPEVPKCCKKSDQGEWLLARHFQLLALQQSPL